MQIDSPVTAPSVSVGKFDFGFKVSPLISHLEEPTYVLTQLKKSFFYDYVHSKALPPIPYFDVFILSMMLGKLISCPKNNNWFESTKMEIREVWLKCSVVDPTHGQFFVCLFFFCIKP